MMDPSDILRLLNTNHYAPANLEEVNDLCRNYPEFNLAHMLKVRIRESLGQDKEKELKVAAIYSSDRRRLFRLVTELLQPVIPDPVRETTTDKTDEIDFSEEPYHHADVIIEQHPFAEPSPAEDLLELEEDRESEDSFILDISEDSKFKEPESGIPETPAKASLENKEIPADKNDLIRNFIKGSPGPIRADQKTTLKGDVSLSSIREHDGFITDTLAKIYVKQRLYAKAIYAYEKLSLKYPEKSAYFAAQIEKVRNINHS